VTFQIIFEDKAINRAAGFLADDPDGLRELLDATDRLADDPRPSESFAFGSPDLRQLRVGHYRVLYRIETDTISVGHIARSTATG
jgi:mRNA interferase RelE/StbE